MNQPKSYSFEDVNDFVHGRDTQYEELQCACLGMAVEIERLQGVIADLIKPTGEVFPCP